LLEIVIEFILVAKPKEVMANSYFPSGILLNVTCPLLSVRFLNEVLSKLAVAPITGFPESEVILVLKLL